MIAYLIIGSELIILYFVFWVVFIRDPKPREIRAELWGHYQQSFSDSSASGSKNYLPPFAKSPKLIMFLPSRMRARLYRITKMRKRENHHFKHQDSSMCHEKYATVHNWRGQSAAVNLSKESTRELAGRFLLLFNKTLNKFSVKIPH